MITEKLAELTTGQVVKRLAGFNGETLGDLACLLGVTRSAVSQKITGRISFKSSEIRTLAQHFGVTSDLLLGCTTGGGHVGEK